VPATSTIDAVNCSTTRPRRNHTCVANDPVFPFRTAAGLKDDKTNAGYSPANSVPVASVARKAAQNPGFVHKLADSRVSARSFTMGISAPANTRAMTAALMFISADSQRNCTTSCPLLAPTTFRTPTSRERFTARAVARLT
jgi:hypothetical protein